MYIIDTQYDTLSYSNALLCDIRITKYLHANLSFSQAFFYSMY